MSKKENRNKKFDELKDEDIYEFPGYPLYPKADDIYNRSKKEQDIDPEDITQRKEGINKEKNNEIGFAEEETGEDLDVPGSELDDEEEKVGSEDEENNYYSLGGDEHDDLDEDKGD